MTNRGRHAARQQEIKAMILYKSHASAAIAAKRHARAIEPGQRITIERAPYHTLSGGLFCLCLTMGNQILRYL